MKLQPMTSQLRVSEHQLQATLCEYLGKPQFRRSYCCEHFEKSYVVPKMRWGG